MSEEIPTTLEISDHPMRGVMLELKWDTDQPPLTIFADHTVLENLRYAVDEVLQGNKQKVTVLLCE